MEYWWNYTDGGNIRSIGGIILTGETYGVLVELY